MDFETLKDQCEVTFLVAGGPGGQHRNKRETGVRLKHLPTGIVVIATERRSQARNLDAALERMMAKLAAFNRKPRPRKPTKPTKASKERRLQSKKARSEIKAARRGGID